MELERSICEEHTSEAAFLWTQRDRAVNDPVYDRSDVAALDERLEAHLDGLRFAGPLGVACSAAGLARSSLTIESSALGHLA